MTLDQLENEFFFWNCVFVGAVLLAAVVFNRDVWRELWRHLRRGPGV